MVPQVQYKPGNVQNWAKLPDIVFKVGGVHGIRLTEAMDAYFAGPDDRDQLMFTNGNFGSSVSCRITVCAPRGGKFHNYSSVSLSSRDIQQVKWQGRYV